MFRRKKPLIIDNTPSPIKVRIVMNDGRTVVCKVSERDFADARYDLGRRNPNPDSLIYIGSIIGHVSDFSKIERM